jgi:hypothetical protein
VPSIFGNADHVLAWLGKDNGDAEEVSTLIHETTKSVQEQIKKLGGIENMPEVQPDDLVRYNHFVSGERVRVRVRMAASSRCVARNRDHPAPGN